MQDALFVGGSKVADNVIAIGAVCLFANILSANSTYRVLVAGRIIKTNN